MAAPRLVKHPVLGDVLVPADIKYSEIDNYLIKQAAEQLPEESSVEVFFDQASEGFLSSARGLSQLADEYAGTDIGFQNTYEEEFMNRVQLEQSPWAGYSGLLLGSVADPVTLPAAFLKPITFASKVGTAAARGAVVGGTAGALEPVYEEFGDSRGFNVAAGTTLGGALGGAAAKILGRGGEDAAKIAEDAAAKTDEEVADALDEAPTPNFKSEEEIKSETFEIVQQDLNTMAFNKMPEDELKAIEAGKTQLNKLVADTEEEIERFQNFIKKGAPPTQKQKKQNENYLNTLLSRIGEYKDRIDGLDDQLKLNQRYNEADAELKNLKNLTKINESKAKLQNRVETLKSKVADSKNKKMDAKSVKALENKLAKAQRELDAFYTRTATPTYDRIVEARLAENAKRKEEYTTKFEEYKAKQAEKPPVEEPVQPAPPRTEDDIVNDYEVRTGLQPRGTSAGSAEARPSAVFAQEAGEGVDTEALVKSVTTRRQVSEKQMVRDEGFDLSPMERHRQALRRMASREQIAKISGVADGRYTVKAIQDLAEELKQKIGQSYDSLMEFVQERVDNRQMFNATEMEILQPLFDEAEAAIPATMTKIRRLIRTGKLDSQEGLEAVQDLQFYNYIGNVRLDQRAQASAALRQYNRAKNIRKGQDTTVKKGKPVDNLFLGLKC
jgi:hypothetical protein